MKRYTVTVYMIISTLIVLAPFLIQQAIDQAHAELQQELSEYESLNQEHQKLYKDFLVILEHVFELEQERDELHEMLLNRALTYQVVIQGMQLATAPREELQLLSRAGRETVVTGATMPVLSPSGFSAASFERAFEQLGARGMAGTGAAFVEAEQMFGVNALALAAIAALESAWGTSKIARDKNNLLGLGAYDSNPYRYAIQFDSKACSIYFAAELLAKHYLNPGGRYYRGYDLTAINRCYATDPAWARKVASVMEIIARAAVEDPGALMAAAAEVNI